MKQVSFITALISILILIGAPCSASTLDTGSPYSTVSGVPGICYEQAGVLFDCNGNSITASQEQDLVNKLKTGRPIPWRKNADGSISPEDASVANAYTAIPRVDGHVSQTLSIQQVSGAMVHNNGQGATDSVQTLPVSSSCLGAAVLFYAETARSANKFKALTQGTDVMTLDGVAGTAGHGAYVLPAVGDRMTCIAVTGGWDCRSGGRAWTAE